MLHVVWFRVLPSCCPRTKGRSHIQFGCTYYTGGFKLDMFSVKMLTVLTFLISSRCPQTILLNKMVLGGHRESEHHIKKDKNNIHVYCRVTVILLIVSQMSKGWLLKAWLLTSEKWHLTTRHSNTFLHMKQMHLLDFPNTLT